MLTEKGTMRTEVIFSDDKTERYLLRKIWDEEKPIVCLIMTNPSSADVVNIDFTVLYSISNLYKLGYGGVDILNMTSEITTKLDTKNGISLNDTNVDFILKSAEVNDKVILAWGKIGETHKKIRRVQRDLLEKLKPYADKLFMIESDHADHGYHPLAPQARFHWEIVPFILPEYLQEKKEAVPGHSTQDEPNEPLNEESEEQPEDEPEKQGKGKRTKKDTHTA